MAYTYDLSGALSTFSFPSGRVQSYSYDAGGQPLAISGSYQGGNTSYASGFNYFASGAVEHVFLGPNSIIQQFCQNNRLQTTGIRVGAPGGTTSVNCANASSADKLNLTLEYPQPPANNGNVLSQAIRTSAPFSATQAYTYDADRQRRDGHLRLRRGRPACSEDHGRADDYVRV